MDVSDHNWKSEEMKGPTSTNEDDFSMSKFFQFNEPTKFGNVSLELGMEFSNLASFKIAMKVDAVHLGRSTKWVKNDAIKAKSQVGGIL